MIEELFTQARLAELEQQARRIGRIAEIAGNKRRVLVGRRPTRA